MGGILLSLVLGIATWIFYTSNIEWYVEVLLLAYFWNTASILYRCYFGRCSSGLVELVSYPYYHGRSTYYFDGLHDFTVTVSRCFRDVNVNTFFPHTARLWNDFQQNGFPWLMISVDLTLDLIVAFYLWVCFLINLLIEFSSLTFFVVPCLVKAFLACVEWTPNLKKKDQWWQIIKYFWEGMETLLSEVPVFH